MAYTETTTTSYGTRVGNSFKAIGSGFLMFLAGTVLLWWNEGRAVKTDKMLNEAQGVCVDMENPNKVDPALDGELICGTALATTNDVLTDAEYSISDTCIGLKRTVEYYQWVENSKSETRDKLGGGQETVTTYTYEKKWVSSPVNSGSFHDPQYQGKNFTLMQVEAQSQWAENVSFGAYKLPASLISSISSKEDVVLNVEKQKLQTINSQLVRQFGGGYSRTATSATAANDQTAANDTNAVASQNNTVDLDFVHQNGNTIYYGRNASSPEVGDVRVTFQKIVPAKVTVVAKVKGDTFTKFKASNGYTFQTLVMGEQTSDEIFQSEHETNNMMLWALRVIGILLVIGGLKGIFGFLETILKVVPFIANIFGWGIGIVCTVVGIVWSLIIIALAWLFYRPVLGITLLVIAGFLIWVFAFKGKDKLKDMYANARTKGEPAQTPSAAPQEPSEPQI